MNPTDMKHYKSSEWSFALDIPKRWNSFPPVSANCPYEVMRFASREDGTRLLNELYEHMAKSFEILAE